MKRTLKNITTSLAAVSLMLSCNEAAVQATRQKNSVETGTQKTNATSASDMPRGFRQIHFTENGIIGKMAYADSGNFLHKKIYPCAKCLLRDEVAQALMKADTLAREQGFQLVIYDCYRPKKYQRIMFEMVHNPKYVADTVKGSNHNKACAVDLSLVDKYGRELDMGTKFDDFTEASHMNNANISATAKKNRFILQELMKASGFEIYENEWWHFNYKNCSYPVSSFLWTCP